MVNKNMDLRWCWKVFKKNRLDCNISELQTKIKINKYIAAIEFIEAFVFWIVATIFYFKTGIIGLSVFGWILGLCFIIFCLDNFQFNNSITLLIFMKKEKGEQ